MEKNKKAHATLMSKGSVFVPSALKKLIKKYLTFVEKFHL